MQFHHPLSPTARPFQLMATSLLTLVDDTPQDHPAQEGPRRSSPPRGSAGGLPVRGPPPFPTTSSMMMGCPRITPCMKDPLAKGVEVKEVEVARAVVTPTGLAPLGRDERKRMDFQARSKFLNSVVKKVIPMMWPMPLGSGSTVSLTTVTIIRIHTSCHWLFCL